MPNFYVWPRSREESDCFWVYGIDEFDAREQIASTLRIDTHDEDDFGCTEDARFKVPLNLILHDTGEWTEVVAQKRPRCRIDDYDGPENPEI